MPVVWFEKRNGEEGQEMSEDVVNWPEATKCLKGREHDWFYEIGRICENLKPGETARACFRCMKLEIGTMETRE